MSALPPPLVSADVDLRSFSWFPFHHRRLRQSSFWKRASDLACRISVDFWAEAFEQVPAGSLPNDDYILAEWAGFGRRNLDGWSAVKDEVMSAWTLCSDGRWYHPTLCEVARSQWAERQQHLWERECDRIRKANVRRAKDGLEPTPFPPKPSDTQSKVAQLERPAKDGAQPTEATATETADDLLSNRTVETSAGRPPDGHGIPAENALKGKGKRKGKDKEIYPSPLATSHTKPRNHPYPPDAFATWYSRYPRKQARSDAEKAFRKIEKADDTPFDALLAGIDAFWKIQPDVKFWPHPASWLNGQRWLDEPASAAAAGAGRPGDEPRVDFGGGVSWGRSVVRKQVERWQADPASWPEGTLGPPPHTPGCKVPTELLQKAA